MEGRMTLFLALGLLTGTAGCSALKSPPPQTTERITLSSPSDPAPEKANEPPAKLMGPAVYVAKGDFCMRTGRDKGDTPSLQQKLYDNARKAYQQAIQVDPHYTQAYQ